MCMFGMWMVCAYVCGLCLPVHATVMEARDECCCLPPLLFTLVFFCNGSSLSRSPLTDWKGWWVSSWEPLIQIRNTIVECWESRVFSALCVDSENPNSDPHVCLASTLLLKDKNHVSFSIDAEKDLWWVHSWEALEKLLRNGAKLTTFF